MDKIYAIQLLREKAQEVGRLPKKSDFSALEICGIKEKLGPWNRALEEAGLKEVSKHYTAKREKVQRKRELKKQSKKRCD